MLNIHICIYCDTFLCEKTAWVPHFNGKGDMVYEREFQVVLSTGKN